MMSTSSECDITESDAMQAPLDGLRRLCKALGMPEGGSGERRALVMWLIFTGHVAPSEETRRKMMAWA